MEFIGCLILLVFLLIIVGFIAKNIVILSLASFALFCFIFAYRSNKNNANQSSKNNVSFDNLNEQPEQFDNNQVYNAFSSDDNDYSDSYSTLIQMPEEYKKYTRVRKIENDYTVLDFETTGLNSLDDEIIEIAAIKYKDDIEISRFHSYVYPQRNDISERITSITGISMDTVNDSPTIDELLPDLVEFISNENIVAHNASFDMKFLLQNMYNEGLDYQKFRVIDTLPLARRELPFLKNHKLVTIKEFLKMDVDSHEAQNDCLVTANLYQYIKRNQ